MTKNDVENAIRPNAVGKKKWLFIGDKPVQDWRAHDLVIRAVDCRAITTSQVPDVLQEWREPSHREFRPRNLWSLFNAFTEAYKGQNPAITMHRSEALHGLCDGAVGLN
jgi:hypothetical protein